MKICFIGTVNAMPMMYAKLFKSNNYPVKYIVDVPSWNTLSRPENHFSDIKYPYDNWIKEIVIKRPSVKTVLPRFFFRKILKEVYDCNVFFLNDWYISLAPFLPKNSFIIIIPHGSDLDTWCNPVMARSISKVCKLASLSFFKNKIASIIIKNMQKGLDRANIVTYFPEGFNSDADRILEECRRKGKKIVRRYDVDTSIVDFKSFSKSKCKNSRMFKICSAVRFDYIVRKEVENKYLKGNDLIIKGISRFYKEVSKDISVVFFEKGQDVEKAKELCELYGISEVVEWKKTVSLNELLNIMSCSDVCFDQVGQHWVGAVGVYALLLDKPLIANYDQYFFNNIPNESNPILKSESVDDIFKSLKLVFERKEKNCLVENINRDFALSFFEANKVFQEYIFLIDEYFVE